MIRSVRVELEEYNELRLVLRVEGRLLAADRPGANDLGPLRAAHYGVPGPAVPARPVQLHLQRARLAQSRRATSASRSAWTSTATSMPSSEPPRFSASPSRRPARSTSRSSCRTRSSFRTSSSRRRWTSTRPARRTGPPASRRDRGLAVDLRDMDELYPKEIELTPESRVIIHFWPPHGDEKTAQPEGGRQSPHGRRARLRHRRVRCWT